MALKKCWAIFHFDPKTVQVGGSGYFISAKDGGIRTFYLDEQETMSVADEIASRHPGEYVIVLEAKYTVEAKIPETTHKLWKDNHELIPIERTAKSKKREGSVRLDLEQLNVYIPPENIVLRQGAQNRPIPNPNRNFAPIMDEPLPRG